MRAFSFLTMSAMILLCLAVIDLSSAYSLVPRYRVRYRRSICDWWPFANPLCCFSPDYPQPICDWVSLQFGELSVRLLFKQEWKLIEIETLKKYPSFLCFLDLTTFHPILIRFSLLSILSTLRIARDLYVYGHFRPKISKDMKRRWRPEETLRTSWDIKDLSKPLEQAYAKCVPQHTSVPRRKFAALVTNKNL